MPILTPSLRLLCWIQLAFVALGAALGMGFGQLQLGASIALGALLMLANVFVIAWTSWRTLMKKSIAWTSVIIVIKYAVLLGSIVVLARKGWFQPLGFGLGIASFVVALLIMALVSQQKEKE